MPFLEPAASRTAADVVAHLDHAVNVCGEDHVGIGTDGGTTGIDDMAAYRAAMRAEVAGRRAAGIGAPARIPTPCRSARSCPAPDQYRRLIALLEARRWSARRIEKVMGLNFIAFAREVWG